MSTELAPLTNAVPAHLSAALPALPWRDPHTVPPEVRKATIQSFEQACRERPESPDLRTCLALVYAVNYEPYKSLDSLQEALKLNPDHFFAQLKLAELWYRLRALPHAEVEALKALNLATNQAEYQMARNQLQTIRRLNNNSWARPTWDKPMMGPALAVAAALILALGFKLWL